MMLKPSAFDFFKHRQQSDFNLYYAGEKSFSPSCILDFTSDCYVMEYCAKGGGQLALNNHIIPIQTGDFFIIPPGKPVSLTAERANPYTLLWIDISGIRMAYILQQMGYSEVSPVFPWRNNKFILNCFSQLCAINSRNDPAVELDILSCLYNLFAECFRQASRYDMLPVNKENDYVSAAIRYMEVNYYKNPRISDIAANLGITRNYLYSLFEKQLHESPQEYLNHLRVKKACDFLMNPYSTVEEIAVSLNCQPQNLTRLFKQTVGLTPSQYRQKQRQEGGRFSEKK